MTHFGKLGALPCAQGNSDGKGRAHDTCGAMTVSGELAPKAVTTPLARQGQDWRQGLTELTVPAPCPPRASLLGNLDAGSPE